jgi:predicted permease
MVSKYANDRIGKYQKARLSCRPLSILPKARPMFATAAIIFPVFALILAGYVARRCGVLGPTASSELNRFVVWMGLPALLFRITATADWATLWQWEFAAVFAIAGFAIYGAVLLGRLVTRRPLADSSIDGLNAAYCNTGYMGFPLCHLMFGEQSLAFVTVATIFTVCVLFAVAIIMVEVGVQQERRPLRLLMRVGLSLIKNPLLLAPALGALWGSSGAVLPGPVESLLVMLGGAASPCALVSLGLFLAADRPGQKGIIDPISALLTLIKLVAVPALVAVLALWVFPLDPLAAGVAILLAALPTGTGSFMVAEYYRREAVITSRTILLSTVGSVITITVISILFGLDRLHP